MRTLTQPLNMSPGGIPPVIHVSQYDSDFTIVFTLFSTVGDFTIENGTTAMVRGTKSSGTGYSADAAINISAKTVTVTGNQQMTAAAGQNVFEITLLKSGKEISSKNFILLCERAALDADTITDESVLKELNAIIESADTATQAAEEAEDAADRAEAAAQTFVIDSTLTLPGQPADAKATGDAIAQIVPGLSETAKAALLNCFAHVAWVDEHGQDYYDALYDALYGSEPYWDFEWDASSGTLPEDMTADAYDFTTEPGALYIQKPNLDFDYIGNCRIQIEAKFFNKLENDDPLYSGNNPQMVITNAQPSTGLYQGIKIITGSTLNPENPKTHNRVAVGINGTNALIDDVYATDYHVYDIIANNNVYSLSIDGETVSLTQNSNTNAYFGTTGITAATDNAKFFACIKSIKFRRGEA